MQEPDRAGQRRLRFLRCREPAVPRLRASPAAMPHLAVLAGQSGSPAAWEQTADRCPGCNRGRRVPLDEIKGLGS